MDKNPAHLLGEKWDLDPSASDNESYEIEMAQEETLPKLNEEKKTSD